MKAWTLSFVLLAVSALSVGCAGSRASGLCEKLVQTPKQGNIGTVEAKAAAAWNKRKFQKKLEESIVHYREAVAIAPKKTENYIKLAKALYFWGDGYLRFQERDDEMIKAFEEATFFAERALKIQNNDFQESVCAKDSFDVSVKKIRKSDVSAVYWYATALGKYGLAKSIVIVLDNKDRIYAMMKRVRKLAPSFHHGAADRYLGAFFTKIPFPKGDTKKSARHFRKSIARSPNYLATRVLMAQMLAPKLKNRKMFVAHLQYVIDAPLNIIPGMEPEHIIEKKKAKALLEDVDTLFSN